MPQRVGDAERAAGVAGRGLNPEVLEGPFAQEPAVADAVERDAAGQAELARPVSRCAVAIRSITSSVISCTDRARSISRCVTGASGSRRTAEQPLEPGAGHRQAVDELEVLEVQPDAAVVVDVDDVIANRLDVLGSPYGASPMTLYSPSFTLKPVK